MNGVSPQNLKNQSSFEVSDEEHGSGLEGGGDTDDLESDVEVEQGIELDVREDLENLGENDHPGEGEAASAL